MRHCVVAALPIALLLLAGCGGSHAPTPTSPLPTETPPQAAALGTPFATAGTTTSALGLYTLAVDPATLSATVELREVRSGQANDDLYALSIDSFLRANSLRITGVSATAATIDVGYSIEHPFPAPNNPTGTPNGSTNRSDLGIAGMVCFLTDVASTTGNTYFADRVANTATVANADAYFSPGQLLNLTLQANTFPYQQLVDEVAGGTGSRIGQSNGGDVTGNFGADGWTRAEYGANNDAWTGYGVLHQGQTSTNTVSLNKSALSAGFTFDVAIIAKYNDPRGGATPAEKKANRLPPAAADASLFAYRMPHGALDVSRIEVLPFTDQFAANAISSSTLRFRVDDWDARATETSAADLSEDPSFTNVAVGASGVPTLEVCLPGVLQPLADTSTTQVLSVVDDDSGYGGDAGQDSGAPGDGLFFENLITKGTVGGQTAGTYTGLVRATDVETAWIGLDPSLNPLGTPPAPVTYQAFTVDLGTGNALPQATVTVTTPLISPGTAVSIEVTGVSDGESEDIDILVDWDDDGTYTLAGTLMSPYPANTPYTSPITYGYTPPAPDIRNLPVRLSDGINTVNIAPVPTFEISASACPSPVPPRTTPDITTGMWDTTGGVGASYWVGPTGTAPWPTAWTHPATAGAAFHGSTLAGNPAGFLGQGISTSSNFYDLLRIRPGALVTDAPIIQIVTDMDSTPTSPLYNRQVADLEIDRTNRVFFTLRNAGFYSTAGSASYNYTYANTSVYWFDYSGTVVGESGLNTITASSPIVALALDGANNVFALDNQHVLHQYVRNGATAYTENTTAPYPMNLKLAPISIGANTGTGATNRKIHDFVIDWHNGAMFFLVETGLAATAGVPDGYIYRVECDGSFQPTLGANPNPRNFILAEATAQLAGCDLEIDHLNAAGTTGAFEDAQLFVIGFNNAGSVDEFVFNSDLGLTLSYDASTTGAKATFAYSDGTGWPNNIRLGGNGSGSIRLYYTTPPGWQ